MDNDSWMFASFDEPVLRNESYLAKRYREIQQREFARLKPQGPFYKSDYEIDGPEEFKPRPAVEKTKVKAPEVKPQQKITEALENIHGLLLEGLVNMEANGVDDVYNMSKIRDLVQKLLSETTKK